MFTGFSFESAGALGFVNEYSGFAVAPAHYIAFAELKHARPCGITLSLRERDHEAYNQTLSSPPSSASTGPTPSTTSVCRLPAARHANSAVVAASAWRPSTQWAQLVAPALRPAHRRCLELAKGPLVYALQKYDFFVLFPVNPATLAKYREAFKPSRAKDDPTDAELALELLLRHREQAAAAQAAKRCHAHAAAAWSNSAAGWSATRPASPIA